LDQSFNPAEFGWPGLAAICRQQPKSLIQAEKQEKAAAPSKAAALFG
jgi:hypothetical protein